VYKTTSIMVSIDNRTGLYVTVPIYFCLLAAATYWAYKRMEKMKHQGVSDKLSAHYLGGRDFGPWLTAGTLFASLFSGYTVVGVPNEAYRLGWYSIRWIPSLMGIVAGYFGTGLRLRKASMIRNHQSPVDFITDRYQSQLLRYTIVFLQVLPTLIYLAAQVIAIKGTFNSIFELDPDATYPVIIIMFLILIFEWLGGLNSVALTDSIQGKTAGRTTSRCVIMMGCSY
jgi:Na+/proline symporter